MHSREFDRDPYHSTGARDGIERAGIWAVEFVRSRTADQWLMFLAGVVVGMIVG
jgi:hypothetical protein